MVIRMITHIFQISLMAVCLVIGPIEPEQETDLSDNHSEIVLDKIFLIGASSFFP